MLLNKLRDKIYKRVIVVLNFFIIRNAFVALIAYIEDAIILQNNSKNRF